MIDLSPVDRIVPDDKIEIVKQKQQEYKMVGSLSVPKGMKLFSFNTETCEIKEVVAEHTVMLDIKSKKPIAKHKAYHDPRCAYVLAINYTNAYRKINKKFGLTLPIL